MAGAQFLFQTGKNLLCEVGSARAKLPGIVKGYVGAKGRALVVTDPGITRLGLAAPAMEGMKAAGVDVVVYDEVMADPKVSAVEAATALAKEGVGCVIGFGGGSSMDVAKVAAVLACSPQPLDEMYGVDQVAPNTPRLPLVQVPTTAGTGSEVTPISILTTGDGQKKGIVDAVLYPDYAVLDGELTLTVPPQTTAATGIDAMVHCIEAYTGKNKKNVLSDTLAVAGLKLLGRNLHRVVLHDPLDTAARGDMLLGACLAGMAFANSPVAAVHALAYPIGAGFGVSHGLSNSLMLQHIIRFNAQNPRAAQHYAELAPYCFPSENFASTSPEGLALELADKYAQLAVDLKMALGLRDVGIGAEDVPNLADQAMLQQRLLQHNPREVGLEDATALYTAAL
eukprot:TRINITY_DN30843_c0_g1_i1.p1 TRINITY_DN30843_c0_g1~~TRINITY_DN30843_c0_g1_i1.p1  ORF type:complete len:416 (+),score=148.28 TRINITY_DN30843_c0_g1_i1:61-1248(+)